MTGCDARTYRVRVTGHLDDRWSPVLGGLVVAHDENGTSTLTGRVVDQAQLHGILDRLRDLGVTLLSLQALDGDGAAVSRVPAGPARDRDAQRPAGC